MTWRNRDNCTHPRNVRITINGRRHRRCCRCGWLREVYSA